MRCDPISWKQSLFTASDRANLFLHQLREAEGGGGGGEGHLSHSHFRTVQPAHVQYILEAEGIDPCFSFHTNTLPYSHLFLSTLRS